MRTTLISYSLGFLSIILFVAGFLFLKASLPMSENTQTQIFEVKSGMTLKEVSQELFHQNLIRSANAFQTIAFIQDKEKLIKVGEYYISPSMPAAEILQRITSGKTVLHSVTIPEGYRITEIANLLEKRNLVDKNIFLQQAKNVELLEGVPTGSLEGYLFPDTYHFGKRTTEAIIIKKMVETFKERALKKEFLKRAGDMGFSYHEIITLASLIEKETGKDSERKQISSVFHNRLKKNMLLQTDPTVIYVIDMFDGNIRKRDLKIDSPYNTYLYKGLPPGPIANPGLKSIIAALYPANTSNLYFVSKQDGSHKFSATLNEHNRAVQKYQLRKIGR